MLLTWPVIGWPMEARAQPMMCRLDALAPPQSHTLGESKNHRQEIVLRLLQEPTLVDLTNGPDPLASTLLTRQLSAVTQLAPGL